LTHDSFIILLPAKKLVSQKNVSNPSNTSTAFQFFFNKKNLKYISTRSIGRLFLNTPSLTFKKKIALVVK